MNRQIEGKDVEPDLITLIEKPHLVPVQMMGEGYCRHGHDDLPDLYGYLDGQIEKMDAVNLVRKMRELVSDILASDIGEKLPCDSKDVMDGRCVSVFGRELTITRALKNGLGLLKGECHIMARDEDVDSTYLDNVSIAEEGYLFPQKTIDERGMEWSIPLDTEGHWLGKEGQHLTVVFQEKDGKILTSKDAKYDEVLRIKNASYSGEFYKVADLSDISMPNTSILSHRIAIARRIYNILLATHKTCLPDQELPEHYLPFRIGRKN